MTVKTAISMDDVLFQKAEALASALSLTRSGFVALAVQEFIERYENQRMLETLNDVYADAPDQSETDLLQQQRAKQRERVEGQW